MHGGLRVCRKAMALAVSRANPTRRSNERSGADERIPLEDNEEERQCRNIAVTKVKALEMTQTETNLGKTKGRER